MKRFIAIAHPRLYLPNKRDALLFDQIGLIGLGENLAELPVMNASEIEWLCERKVVADASVNVSAAHAELRSGSIGDFYTASHAYAFASAAALQLSEGDMSSADWLRPDVIAALLGESWSSEFIDVDKVATLAYSALSEAGLLSPMPDKAAAKDGYERLYTTSSLASTRAIAQYVTASGESEAVPLLTTSLRDVNVGGQQIATTAHVVLSALPVPDDSVPWEAIVDFRHDENGVGSLRRLRRWMRTMVSTNASEREIRDELEFLLHEYEEHLRLHRMKTQRGKLETVLTVTADVVENLLKLQLSKMIEAVFALQKEDVALLEAERSAPGREVAYIVAARKHFDGRA